jgi:hypothetical protein
MIAGLIAFIVRQNHRINNAYLSSVMLMAYQLLRWLFPLSPRLSRRKAKSCHGNLLTVSSLGSTLRALVGGCCLLS